MGRRAHRRRVARADVPGAAARQPRRGPDPGHADRRRLQDGRPFGPGDRLAGPAGLRRREPRRRHAGLGHRRPPDGQRGRPSRPESPESVPRAVTGPYPAARHNVWRETAWAAHCRRGARAADGRGAPRRVVHRRRAHPRCLRVRHRGRRRGPGVRRAADPRRAPGLRARPDGEPHLQTAAAWSANSTCPASRRSTSSPGTPTCPARPTSCSTTRPTWPALHRTSARTAGC